MNLEDTSACLEALGNPTRLAVFRLLVEAGIDGVPVGTVQKTIGVPASTLSHHLARLMRVGLVSQERQSRTLICRADYDVMNGVIAYLNRNCCVGIDAEISAA
jgi:ArsR family transcriptional regulator, arsenate/arsenite/antimonite-responsive transcriptional repressor